MYMYRWGTTLKHLTTFINIFILFEPEDSWNLIANSKIQKKINSS